MSLLRPFRERGIDVYEVVRFGNTAAGADLDLALIVEESFSENFANRFQRALTDVCLNYPAFRALHHAPLVLHLYERCILNRLLIEEVFGDVRGRHYVNDTLDDECVFIMREQLFYQRLNIYKIPGCMDSNSNVMKHNIMVFYKAYCKAKTARTLDNSTILGIVAEHFPGTDRIDYAHWKRRIIDPQFQYSAHGHCVELFRAVTTTRQETSLLFQEASVRR